MLNKLTEGKREVGRSVNRRHMPRVELIQADADKSVDWRGVRDRVGQVSCNGHRRGRHQGLCRKCEGVIEVPFTHQEKGMEIWNFVKTWGINTAGSKQNLAMTPQKRKGSLKHRMGFGELEPTGTNFYV